MSDPRPNEAGWSAVGEIGGQTVSLSVHFGAAPTFGNVEAGDEVILSGTLRGAAPDSDWAISRHIVGRVAVSELHDVRGAGGLTGARMLFGSSIDPECCTSIPGIKRCSQVSSMGMTVIKIRSMQTTFVLRDSGICSQSPARTLPLCC